MTILPFAFLPRNPLAVAPKLAGHNNKLKNPTSPITFSASPHLFFPPLLIPSNKPNFLKIVIFLFLNSKPKSKTMATGNLKNQSSRPSLSFQDQLPLMAEKLGGDGLIGELCNGFRLLMDGDKGVITFDSLKKNAALLGLQDLTDEDLRGMLKEGDFDGDGALSEMEFCVLMFRLSPDLMEHAEDLLDQSLQDVDDDDQGIRLFF